MVLTGNVEESNKKNLLTSALGLTAGIFSKQVAEQRRGSIESNDENPGVPLLTINKEREMFGLDESRSLRGSAMTSKLNSRESPTRSPNHSPRESFKNGRESKNLARSSV